MTRSGRVGVTTAMALLMAGCLEHTYHTGSGAPLAPVAYEEWHHHWIGGLIGERELDIREHCPSGNATVHDEQSFLNGLVAMLTSGIYVPTTVTIRCDDATQADLELDEGTVVAILEAPVFLDRVEEVVPHRIDEARDGVRALQQDNQD